MHLGSSDQSSNVSSQKLSPMDQSSQQSMATQVNNTLRQDALLEQNPLIVIASNRGPFAFKRDDDGQFTSSRGAGGLVTALSALAEKHDVLWVASALSEDDRIWAEQNPSVTNIEGIDLRLIIPDEDQYRQYYNVIANPLLWFIQHQMWDSVRNPSITEETWRAWEEGYVAINKQFADAIIDSVKDVTDRPIIIFPQDYHLYLVSQYLRDALGDSVQIQPFVHIPWPSPDAWRILPEQMRGAMLKSLLLSDRVGFQTKRDAFNFIQVCRLHVNDAHSFGSRNSIVYKDRKVGVIAYPISIDVEKVNALAQNEEADVNRASVNDYVGDRKLILRIDRIEPSKNILRGLEAFKTLLELHPEHHGQVQMLALLVPSRMDVDEYQSYLQEIMATSGFINAQFGDGNWEPVRTVLGDNYPRAIAAMTIYDVLLVNPIADGMNLVAKEGPLVNKRDGVLVLSEHAGAFYELGDYALTVSPFDVFSTAQAMHIALMMPKDKRKADAEALRQIISSAGVKQWFYTQLEDALEAIQSNKSSTPDTPDTTKSALSRTETGVSSESTPIANA